MLLSLAILQFILILSLASILGQAEKPFLQRLIEVGFAKSELNVVYFTSSGSMSGTLLTGDFPRLLMPQSTAGRLKRDGKKIRIASQAMVVIDGRDEPVGNCLAYLRRELERIVNPGSNKFVLLVDLAFTQSTTGNDMLVLVDALGSFGIGYTALLSFDGSHPDDHPHSVTRISFAETVSVVPTDLVDLWSIFRFDVRSLKDVRVSGVLYNNIPFSYTTDDGDLSGTDVHVWNVIAQQLRFRLHLVFARPEQKQYVGGAYSPAMRNMSVHFVATRDLLIADGLPRIHLYARDHLSLIVPRPFTRSLIDALLQPFTVELWILIGVFVCVRVVAGHVTVGGNVHAQPWFGWTRLAADVLTFILIEAYLAKVTSLLLTLRYTEGPRTLEQFLATGLPIVEPLGGSYVQFQADPVLAARLRERFVRMTISELRKSTEDCYVELRSRVVQLAHGTDPYDAVTGRRNFYILDEPLGVVHFQYAFAKETAIKQVIERCLDQYEENGVRVRIDQYYERWAQVQKLRRQSRFSGTVLSFRDMQSLWLCVGLGWCISATVFVAEYIIHNVARGLPIRFGQRKQ